MQNHPSESVALSTRYRVDSTGVTESATFNLYAYSLILNSAKTVKSVTPRQNRNVVVLTMTLTGSGEHGSSRGGESCECLQWHGNHCRWKAFQRRPRRRRRRLFRFAARGHSQLQFQLDATGNADVVSGKSAAIVLPAGKYSTLAVLATGVNGAQLSQQFKVTCTDGTS